MSIRAQRAGLGPRGGGSSRGPDPRIKSDRPGSGSGGRPASPTLVHQALPYASDEELLSCIEPFAREGIDAGQKVIAITTPRNVGLLREALGARADQVEAVDGATWYRAPMRTLAADHRYVEEHRRWGRVRVIGEIPWPLDRPAEVRGWTRYQSVVNAALATRPVWSICLYDLRVLPASIVVDAERTHPHLMFGRASHPSRTYVEPGDFCRAMDDSEPLAPAPPDADDRSFSSAAELSSARRFVETVATRSGMSRNRVLQAVLATNEVATNALRHGGGRGDLRCWIEAGELIVRIEDGGKGLSDPLAGCLPPGTTQVGGFGLWLVRQMGDQVEIRSGAAGATVQLWFDIA
jgi:anti-sigma regulatory factor (Ser/Thr protein kinase)